MSISNLINGQNIKIDNHKSGVGIRCDDNGLHIHKRMNRHSNFGTVNIRIPLNGNEQIDFSDFKGGKDIEKRLYREIIEALKNKEKVKTFVTEVLSWIEENGNCNRINKDAIRELAIKTILSLRNHFDSYPRVAHNFEVAGDEVIGHFWPMDTDSTDQNLFIKADILSSTLSISRDRQYI
jgi:hypothetical protein